MNLFDTHAHIHSNDYPLGPEEVFKAAHEAGVTKILCVGTDEHDSERAVEFAAKRDGCYASVGLHPHDAKLGKSAFDKLQALVNREKVVAIGECGLDYYYTNSPKDEQKKAFRYQIELALTHKLPLVFHVRDAFEDFWEILKDYQNVNGVVHSFSANTKELDKAVNSGLYVGFNGIMTFTKDQSQLEALKQAPLERIVLETDAPFLTPVPKRGTINQPANVRLVAEFVAAIRGESPDTLAEQSTANACSLFGI